MGDNADDAANLRHTTLIMPRSRRQSHAGYALGAGLLTSPDPAARTPKDRLSAWPVSLPRDWVAYVKKPQTKAEEQAVRQSVNRGTPLGDENWQKQTIRDLAGIDSSATRPAEKKR